MDAVPVSHIFLPILCIIILSCRVRDAPRLAPSAFLFSRLHLWPGAFAAYSASASMYYNDGWIHCHLRPQFYVFYPGEQIISDGESWRSARSELFPFETSTSQVFVRRIDSPRFGKFTIVLPYDVDRHHRQIHFRWHGAKFFEEEIRYAYWKPCNGQERHPDPPSSLPSPL